MTDQKALEIALLIKRFGRCMTTEDEVRHLTLAREFNEAFDAFLSRHETESVATLAAHIARAIAPPDPIHAPPHPDIYAQVLPDLLHLRSLGTPQDPRRPERKVG